MRDSFNFDMLPIVQDNMNCFPGVKCLSSISSNGYYGYQAPPVETKQKEDASPGALVQSCDMDVQYFENFTSNQMASSRKRSWECNNDLRDFKKRRQNEKIHDNGKRKNKDALLEELLRETHGCSIYHWTSDD